MTAIGLIIHWGLYSIPAYDDPQSARHRRIQNGSEWLLARLIEKGTFRPVSGYQETQAYYKENYGDQPYEKFQESFPQGGLLSIQSQMQEWINIATKLGATYMILTAKHHDGYCLWPTKTTPFHARKNLVKSFCYYVRKAGLKCGLYYSWMEFDKSATKAYLQSTVIPQIEELKAYQPDIWWFDGDWPLTSQYSHDLMTSICQELRMLNPKVEINDRIGLDKELRKDLNYLGLATYRVYADRYLPDEKAEITVPWEHVTTIGLSWGRNRQQTEVDYKTGAQLYETYRQVKSKNGRLLLNVGPNPDGTLDPMEFQRLEELAVLLNDPTQ